MGDISALVKDNSRGGRPTDPSCFVDPEKGVRMEVDNGKVRKALLLGLCFFKRFVLGSSIYEKRISTNWGKWVRERQQEKWIVAEIQKVSRLSKLWSRYSFNNGAVSQLAFEYGVAETVIQKFFICVKRNNNIRV